MSKIKDGIINEDKFGKLGNKKKLLWVLKEVNDPKGKKDWDLTEFLRVRDSKEGLFSYEKWKNTFGLLCKVSWGILTTNSFDEINEFDDKKLTDILDYIAVANLKKSPGISYTDMNLFKREIEKENCAEKIFDQINTQIKPEIIICGNTFHLTNVVKDENFDFDDDWTYVDSQNRIWINSWHPNVRKKNYTHEKHFNEVINAFKKAEIQKQKSVR
ncbi:MAG: hypothetical protein A2W93_09970 [Bacteroidetes bacterium GWF2_43_63]|nr:MAG: hypothetical protein A2W94_02495 [Bacteroidetes bacterium GWE2_42_42]OFY52849.1 MAG: hypothetical protein A2W93_09970 [Bacteroidetes bacterium GWF2_43_63]HBG70055.1 hypothetical protein [Bacteroidales bacterium]HCB62339.1 hypothetical protein [Bacteroidales bacterium]